MQDLNLDHVILSAARAAHEANRSWCFALGDFSQPLWEEAPEWQRNSALAGVRAIHANPATTPEQSHQSWMEQKASDGWTWGPVKDPETKTHPCMVPYDLLPIEQRAKDHIFGQVVRALLHAAGALAPVTSGTPRSITREHIDALAESCTWSDTKLGEKMTVVCCRLPNGFEVVESSGCVDPANYNHELGVAVCRRRIIDRLWHLEGYRLQCELAKG